MVRVSLIGVVILAMAGCLGSASSPSAPARPVRVLLVYSVPERTREATLGSAGVIYRASLTGKHPVRLAVGQFAMLSPDGRWVAYGGGSDVHPTLQLLSTAGGAPTRLVASRGPIAWSPDSKLLLASTPGTTVTSTLHPRLLVISVPSGKVITSMPAPLPSYAYSFSPDDSQIVFGGGSRTQGPDIYTVPTNGGAIHRLTNDHRSAFPLWGSSGIAFERYRVNAPGDPRCASGPCGRYVWLMNPTGAGAHQVTYTHAGIAPAAWSANGSRLLAAQPDGDPGRLFAVTLATGQTRAITAPVACLYPAGLSRDGRTVLAFVWCASTEAAGTIETIPFTGGPPTILLHGPWWAAWNA